MTVKTFRPLKAVSEDLAFSQVTYPKVISLKMDGVFGINKDGLKARSLKKFKNVWITNKLSIDLFKGFVGEILNADTLTDNPELFINRQSLCRDTTSFTNTIKKEDWDFVWCLFDYVGDYSEEFLNKPYSERMSILGSILEESKEARFISEYEMAGISYTEWLVYDMTLIVPMPKVVYSAEEAMELYELAIDMGFEGVVLRAIDGAYKQGRATKKSQEFTRFKPKADEEIVVIAFEEAMINNNEAKKNELGYTERSSHQENKEPSGMIGALLGVNPKSGLTIKIGAGKLTHEERKHIFENQHEYLGMIAKYRSMDTGVKDKPRHARFMEWRSREDMDDGFEDFVVRNHIYVK